MSAFTNLGFETAGTPAGLAADWTYTSSAAVTPVAAFDAALQPWEDFEEEWDSNEDYLFAFAALDLESAEITTTAPTPKTHEDFEEYWDSNQNFVYALAAAVAAFDATPEDFEDFEEEWDSNEGYLFEFVGPGSDLTVGAFDSTPQDFEDFEEEWDDAGYLFEFVGPGSDLTVGQFDIAVPQDVEDFEEEWTTQMMVTI